MDGRRRGDVRARGRAFIRSRRRHLQHSAQLWPEHLRSRYPRSESYARDCQSHYDQLSGSAGRALAARGLSGAAVSSAGSLLPAAERAEGAVFRKWARAAPEPLGAEGLARIPLTECTELPSGLRVATARVPHATSATVGVRIPFFLPPPLPTSRLPLPRLRQAPLSPPPPTAPSRLVGLGALPVGGLGPHNAAAPCPPRARPGREAASKGRGRPVPRSPPPPAPFLLHPAPITPKVGEVA